MSYTPPEVIREWTLDLPGGDFSQLLILDDKTVCSASGRYAQGGGSHICSWSEFVAGALDGVVKKTNGEAVLSEAVALVRALESRTDDRWKRRATENEA